MTPALPKPDYKAARIRRAMAASPKSETPEKVLQVQCEELCRWRGVEILHIPQYLLAVAFHRRPMEGGEVWAAREAASKISGFPDLILFYKGHFRAVELKTEIGSLRQNQKDWIKRLDGVCLRRFEDFSAYLEAFIALVDAREKDAQRS